MSWSLATGYVIRNYPGGVKTLITEFERDLNNALVKEGLGKIRTKFESPNRVGPDDIATFLEIDGAVNREIRKREAFETVSQLLNGLGIERFV